MITKAVPARISDPAPLTRTRYSGQNLHYAEALLDPYGLLDLALTEGHATTRQGDAWAARPHKAGPAIRYPNRAHS